MSDLFSASFLKVSRAQGFIAELERELRAFVNEGAKPVTVTPVTEGDTLTLEIAIKPMPPLPGAIVGDVVHNLRTALDLMATEMVSQTAGQSSKSVYFPFGIDTADLEKQIKDKNFHRAGADAVTLLRTLAPYAGGNTALRAIHDLDIQDKHKTLIPVPSAFNVTVEMAPVDDNKLEISPAQGQIVFHFPADSALAGKPLLPTLKDLVELVEGILQSFARLVAARTP